MIKIIEVLELMSEEKIRYPFNNFVCSSVISVKLTKHRVHDFDFYSSLIASLCSRGELQEAGQVAMEILS